MVVSEHVADISMALQRIVEAVDVSRPDEGDSRPDQVACIYQQESVGDIFEVIVSRHLVVKLEVCQAEAQLLQLDRHVLPLNHSVDEEKENKDLKQLCG